MTTTTSEAFAASGFKPGTVAISKRCSLLRG